MWISTQILRLATILIAALGIWGLWSQGDGDWARVWSDLRAAAVTRPWIWVAAAGWFFAGRRARALERGRGPFRSPDAESIHTPSVAEVVGGESRGRPESLSPGADKSPGRDDKLRRLRLAAMLKGRNPDIPAFIDALLVDAAVTGASDIHLQPHDSVSRVTLRCRGEREEIAQYPKVLHGDVVRRLKVLSGMLPHVSDRAQDGRFSVSAPSGTVQLRASVVPSSHGETVALRLAGRGASMELSALGLGDGDLERFESLLREPQGLLVLTGPTGSGKTTTLYSALAHIHSSRGATAHMASIEDPVEVDLPFVHQMQVDRARQLGFVEALRSLLRQDPDVLMVGEIRDAETAKVAVQAGLSGHLMLTTLHADSAAGVFPRLIDLGVEPFLAGSVTLGCVSQRLVRRLCAHCRHPRALDRRQRARLMENELAVDGSSFFTAEGCAQCGRSGFSGRLALFEMLVMDPELRRLVAAKAPADQLEQVARSKGASSLFDVGMRAAAQGEVALDEILPWAPR